LKWRLGECWDFVPESCPNHGSDVYFRSLHLGYFDRIRHAEAFIKVFPGCEAVWSNDIFRPFLKWVSDESASASNVGRFL
jgi:hypothetical protein